MSFPYLSCEVESEGLELVRCAFHTFVALGLDYAISFCIAHVRPNSSFTILEDVLLTELLPPQSFND